MKDQNLKYYLDLSDLGYWLIKRCDERYSAGYDKAKAEDLIERLNAAHRPSIMQPNVNEVFVCWNCHEKGYKCDFVKEI